MGQIKFMGGILMLTLFAIAVVSYAVGFGNDNDVTVSLNNDSKFSNLNTNLRANQSSYFTIINASSSAFSESEITEDSETTRTGGTFKAPEISIFGSVSLLFAVITDNVLGGRSSPFSFVLGSLITFFAFVSIVYAWKTWKGGNPD